MGDTADDPALALALEVREEVRKLARAVDRLETSVTAEGLRPSGLDYMDSRIELLLGLVAGMRFHVELMQRSQRRMLAETRQALADLRQRTGRLGAL